MRQAYISRHNLECENQVIIYKSKHNDDRYYKNCVHTLQRRIQ